MDGNVTQFVGIGAVALAVIAILSFLVRSVVKSASDKEKLNQELTNKFIDITTENIKTHYSLTEAIKANTDATRQSTDNISKLVLEIIKQKNK